ncbi:MAG: nucleotidyltransferase domain-containing protein [Myxococcota bacterium]|nr:nucleotidyltransferase domain-containing protein [Myxococcota bacterium]
MDERAYWQRIGERYGEALGESLVAVAVFGSRARGAAAPDSDHDVLLIAAGLPDEPFERARRVRLPLLDLGAMQVQVLARTPAEFTADVTGLHLDLALDALVVRERDGWLSSRLARLRELIETAGLERGPNLFWRWRKPPRGPDWAITWEGVRT